MQLRPYQTDSVNSIFNYFLSGKTGNPLVALPTGCHAKGHPILMFDGSIKPVEDVKEGDFLMGPDSKARKVLALARGRQVLVKITPVSSESFVVNLDHIMPFHVCRQKKDVIYKSQSERTENIKISDYLNSTKWFKHIRKLKFSDCIYFENKPLPIDPYFLGLHLGDGSFCENLTFTNMDKELLNWYESFVNSHGLLVTKYLKPNNKAIQFTVTSNRSSNHLKECLIKLGLKNKKSDSKFIPTIFKTNSLENRMSILAGLLDSDGFVTCNCFEITTKSNILAEDILYLARSCGFSANKSIEYKSCQTGNGGLYNRILISGDISKIPCKRKQHLSKISERKQVKNHLVTGIKKIEILPEDDFFGFELDSDHLYLDGNFLIHHNTGKSVIIAEFCKTVFQYWPNQRILMLVHVKELVKQNADKLKQLWPTAPVGIYSAGLKSRDVHYPIVFGGIASVNSNPEQFGHRDLVIVDEAHCISTSENTMYQKVINSLKVINPALKVIGLTATPYRLGQGMITDGGLFTDICFDLTGMRAFNDLIAEGYLAPLIPKRTSVEIDTSQVGTCNGDFKQNELQKAVDVDEITYRAIQELVEYGQARNCGMVFTTGVEHTEHVCAAIQALGETATYVHSKMPTSQRDAALEGFKTGVFKWIVSNGVLTTGFDHPPVDIGGILRPTLSPGLWVQILGRFCRPYDFRKNRIPGFDYVKENALILDFAGNTKRLGPINDPVKPRKKGQKTGEAPIRICPECGVYNHASARKCFSCGHDFPPGQSKIFDHAGTDELIKSDVPVVENFKVDRVIYHRHQKPGSRPILRATYYSGVRKFEEFVALEHPGFAGRKAREWWMQRYPGPHVPDTVEQAMMAISYLKTPRSIRVHTNKKHPEILAHEY